MLNRRTHILFEEETFQLLSYLSKTKGESIGKLVRKAVKKTYGKRSALEEKRREIIREILGSKRINIAPYKASDLVKMGRKFE